MTCVLAVGGVVEGRDNTDECHVGFRCRCPGMHGEICTCHDRRCRHRLLGQIGPVGLMGCEEREGSGLSTGEKGKKLPTQQKFKCKD